jgi:hypothetical protein
MASAVGADRFWQIDLGCHESEIYERRAVRHWQTALFVVRRACSAASGCKSRPNLMEVKGSEAQGRHREVGSEGSVEQRYGPMDKNRI